MSLRKTLGALFVTLFTQSLFVACEGKKSGGDGESLSNSFQGYWIEVEQHAMLVDIKNQTKSCRDYYEKITPKIIGSGMMDWMWI